MSGSLASLQPMYLDVFRGVSRDKIQYLIVNSWKGLLEMQSQMYLCFASSPVCALLNRPLKAIPRDTTSGMSSDTLTKQVVAIVEYNMMFLAKSEKLPFCLE